MLAESVDSLVRASTAPYNIVPALTQAVPKSLKGFAKLTDEVIVGGDQKVLAIVQRGTPSPVVASGQQMLMIEDRVLVMHVMFRLIDAHVDP